MVVTGLVVAFIGLLVLNVVFERVVIPYKAQQKHREEEAFVINVRLILPESQLKKLQLESEIIPKEELAELLLQGFLNQQTLRRGGAPCQSLN